MTNEKQTENKPQDSKIVEAPPTPEFSQGWQDLTFLKSSFALALWTIHQRIKKTIPDIEAKSTQNYLEKTAELVRQFAEKMNSDCAPPQPKSLSNAFDYALSRKYEGTWLALLDENGNLVKTVCVAKNEVWTTMPPVSLVERETTVTMNGKYVVIDGTEFGKTEAHPEKAGQGVAVPKRVASVKPFASKPLDKKIFEYECDTDGNDKPTEDLRIKRK